MFSWRKSTPAAPKPDVVESQTQTHFDIDAKEEDDSTYRYHLGGMTPQEERQLTQEIDRKMNEYRDEMDLERKVLFLGAGESGKSTIIKQMRRHHGNNYNENDYRSAIGPLHENVVTSIQILVEQSFRFTDASQVPPEIDELRHTVRNWLPEMRIDASMAAIISTLWESDVIKETFKIENRRYYQLGDNVSYLMTRLEDICKETYLPNFDDFIYLRQQTHTVRVERFQIEKNSCVVYDVGGQRGERKKWINHFDDVDVVVFVASLAGYNQKCREDDTTVRIQEARELLKNTITLQEFSGTGCVLFLNKLDLFREFLTEFPITVGIPEFPNFFDPEANPPIVHPADYERVVTNFSEKDRVHLEDFQKVNPQDYHNVLRFIVEWFYFALRPRRNSQRYVHLTTATDTNLMKNVCDDVADHILRIALMQGGLV